MNTASTFPFLSIRTVIPFLSSWDIWESVLPSSRVIISFGGILLL
jgi:hypothetical protein